MTTVKTAISLPASLFEQAETLAGEIQIPQSFLSEIALEEFIRRRENQQLLEKIIEDGIRLVVEPREAE